MVVAFNRRHSFQGFPAGSACKESACSVGDLSLIPGLGRFPGERNNYPLQYSGLENSMDCLVHGVAESDTTERLLKKIHSRSLPFLASMPRWHKASNASVMHHFPWLSRPLPATLTTSSTTILLTWAARVIQMPPQPTFASLQSHDLWS